MGINNCMPCESALAVALLFVHNRATALPNTIKPFVVYSSSLGPSFYENQVLASPEFTVGSSPPQFSISGSDGSRIWKAFFTPIGVNRCCFVQVKVTVV